MSTTQSNICLGVRNLSAGAGGISRVARLMAQALGDAARAQPMCARIVTLDDAPQSRFGELPVKSHCGSAVQFVSEIQRAQREHTHFLYDELSMARAHTVLRGRRPSLAFMHGVDVWEEAIPNRLRCARRIDKLITNTEYTRDRAQHIHGGFDDVSVCWLGTEHDQPAPSLPRLDGPPTVLILGRLHAGRDKGHRALIDAWSAVVSRVPAAVLLIAGTGNDESALRAFAAGSSVARQIRFLGFVPDERMDAVWSRAWVFAMPSRGEGFGLVYIEAMRHAVPVVASVHDAGPEINAEGVTGYNVDLDRPDELVDRLVALLRDPLRCRTMGLRGLERWSEHYTYRAFQSRFASILGQFVD